MIFCWYDPLMKPQNHTDVNTKHTISNEKIRAKLSRFRYNILTWIWAVYLQNEYRHSKPTLDWSNQVAFARGFEIKHVFERISLGMAENYIYYVLVYRKFVGFPCRPNSLQFFVERHWNGRLWPSPLESRLSRLPWLWQRASILGFGLRHCHWVTLRQTKW